MVEDGDIALQVEGGNNRGEEARVVGEHIDPPPPPPPPEGGKRRGEDARVQVGEELDREEDSASRSSA
jgi:hypothetical protein